MKWYWWVLVGVLAINGAAIAFISLEMIADRYRRRKDSQDGQDKESGTGEVP
jgi:hypothetical protein